MVKETLKLLKERYQPPTKACKCVTVTLKVENIGFFDAVVEHAGRLCLPSTEKAKQGKVTLIVTPYRFEETMKVLERLKKGFIPELEIVKVEDNCLSLYRREKPAP
jgi:acylphosphatase